MFADIPCLSDCDEQRDEVVVAQTGSIDVYKRQMPTLASDILLMERGQSKAVTGKEHLERNDFIIEKQKAELQLSLIHI